MHPAAQFPRNNPVPTFTNTTTRLNVTGDWVLSNYAAYRLRELPSGQSQAGKLQRRVSLAMDEGSHTAESLRELSAHLLSLATALEMPA